MIYSSDTPSISIIIPCYNQGEYLAEAIGSALNQTVKPQEIIIIDDGSTDHSTEVASKYPVKLIKQVNKGLSSARNTGIMNAKGIYVLPLDADDILLPRCLEKITATAMETNWPDIIAPSFQCFGQNENQVILYGGLTVKDFFDANRIAYCSAIKRQALLEIGGYSPRMTFGYEDWHLWIDLLKRGKTLEVIPEILFRYRVKEISMYTEARKHHDELVAQIKKDHESA